MLFGTVTGRIVATIADRLGDPDVNPDVVPVYGKVRFTPSVDAAISSTEGAIVLPTPIDADLDDEGYLSVNGVRGVSLVATDSPDLNPTGFTYTVSFIDLKFDKFPLKYNSFSMALPAGTTVDLSTATPVGSSNGAIIIRGVTGEPGRPGDSGPQGAPGPAVASALTGRERLANAARNGLISAGRPLVGSGDSHTDVTGGAQFLWQRMQQVGVLPGNGLEGIAAENIVPLGNSGMTLSVYLGGGGPNTLANLLARNPLAIVNCWLVNDVRLGALGSTVTAIRDAGAALLGQLIIRQRQAIPDALIVLRVPFPFTTSNDGSNYIQTASGTINPDGLAQTYTDGIRAAYYAAQQAHPDVAIYDPQTRLTGTVSPTANTGYYGNQIHQSAAGYAAEADDFAKWVSAQQPYQAARSLSAVTANPTAPWVPYFRDPEDSARYVRIAEGVVGTTVAAGATVVDMEMVDPPVAAPGNVTAGDLVVLYTAGTTVVIPQGSTIARQSGTVQRFILSSGALPALPARGRIAVYRRITTADSFVNTVLYDTSYRYKRVGRVIAGGTGYVDLNAVSFGSARAVVPMSESATTAAAGDKVYIEGRNGGAITLAAGSFAAQGNNLRITGGLEAGVDYSTLVGQGFVLVGGHA